MDMVENITSSKNCVKVTAGVYIDPKKAFAWVDTIDHSTGNNVYHIITLILTNYRLYVGFLKARSLDQSYLYCN